nr:hypothetical protein CFP56_79257 [Quercus suber]
MDTMTFVVHFRSRPASRPEKFQECLLLRLAEFDMGLPSFFAFIPRKDIQRRPRNGRHRSPCLHGRYRMQNVSSVIAKRNSVVLRRKATRTESKREGNLMEDTKNGSPQKEEREGLAEAHPDG